MGFRDRFSTPALFVVVHCVDLIQSIAQSDLALRYGADGVFLIGHHMGRETLLRIYENLRAQRPKDYIGLNFLDGADVSWRAVPDGADALWTDNAEHEHEGGKPAVTYFGGIAFKYVHDADDVDAAVSMAVRARSYVDVITTSGSRTGIPPSIEKLRAMRAAIGRHPLAIASGMSPENVAPFLVRDADGHPLVDAFLVASSLERAYGELDPARVHEMSRLIHGG